VRQDPHSSVGQVLVVDAGSSMTKLALVSGEDLARLGSFPTGDDGPAGWFARFDAVLTASVAPRTIGSVAMSSVRRRLPQQLRASWAGEGEAASRSASSAPIPSISRSTIDPDPRWARIGSPTPWP
jgi:hypothetical protein